MKVIPYHRQRHLSIRMLKPKPFKVITILHAPLSQVYEKSEDRILLSAGLVLNLRRKKISTLDELLQIMRSDQSVLADFGQSRMNEIMRIFKKLGIYL